MVLVDIHRILGFRQAPWIKKYVNFNTQKEKEATPAFVKSLAKLYNNSVFGKTMENVRKHRHIELVHTDERARKLASKPIYKSSKIFFEDLAAMELNKVKVTLNKPSFSCMCILDLTVFCFIVKQTTFMMTCYKTSSYLTSDYPKIHPMQNDCNKKVLGEMKDGQPISEFVGLRSKKYAFTCNDKESKRAKGISKVTIKKDLRFDHYKKTLYHETKQLSSMAAIRCHIHQLIVENIVKLGLSAFDDKRFLLDAVNSFAYGHYKIAGLMLGVDIQVVL